jgi:hypothetical protein
MRVLYNDRLHDQLRQYVDFDSGGLSAPLPRRTLLPMLHKRATLMTSTLKLYRFTFRCHSLILIYIRNATLMRV